MTAADRIGRMPIDIRPQRFCPQQNQYREGLAGMQRSDVLELSGHGDSHIPDDRQSLLLCTGDCGPYSCRAYQGDACRLLYVRPRRAWTIA